MITLTGRGNFDKTTRFLKNIQSKKYKSTIDRYAQKGVQALSSVTPKDTGNTASCWGYEIVQEKDSLSIFWTNSHVEKGVNIAVILQYGHGTRNGGYVVGRDYINPSIRPVFEEIARAVWKEVINA